jgi:hypothetical protein
MKKDEINLNIVANEKVIPENEQKKSKKKKIVKIILIIIGVFIALDIFFMVIGVVFSDDDSDNTSTVQTVEENEWVKLSGDTNLGYGYKKTPEEFTDSITEYFNISLKNVDDSNDALELYNSLEYLEKYEHDEFDEYVYAYSKSGNNLGYYIDYDGTYIGEAKSVVSLEVANDNPSQAKNDLCIGIIAILYAYGEIDYDKDKCDELFTKIEDELTRLSLQYPNETAWYMRYGEYVITYSSDEQYAIRMSSFKSDDENIKTIENVAGYTLVDVK